MQRSGETQQLAAPAGAAQGAPIYWDASTGEVDSSEPPAIVQMPHPAQHTRYPSQSTHLAHGQTYRFVIRVATGIDDVLPGPVHAAGGRGVLVAGSGLAAVGAAAEADRRDEEVPARRQFLSLLALTTSAGRSCPVSAPLVTKQAWPWHAPRTRYGHCFAPLALPDRGMDSATCLRAPPHRVPES